MSDISIALDALLALCEEKQGNNKIQVKLRPNRTIGKVQDDVFDEWTGDILENRLADYEITHSGKLTTPDIIIRHRESRELIGLEVKKIDQKSTGKDSRGLTLDYNSCIPCGKMQIKIGGVTSTIRTYYFFALLSQDQKKLVSTALIDGDFLNYDFDLHLKGKYLNTSTYGHGSYGEGSVRGRAMYNYPNPMNTDIEVLFSKNSFIVKEELSYQLDKAPLVHVANIERQDINNNIFIYRLYWHRDEASDVKEIKTIKNIFGGCKKRKGKPRTAYMTEIAEAPAPYNPKKS